MNRIIARLDIKNTHVIKGIQFEGLRKIGDPNDYAVKYYKQGADELLIVDMVASLYERDALYNIVKYASKNCFIPITVSGGVREIKDIRNLLAAGADKIGINTQAILNPTFLKEAIKIFGAQSIVASIESRYIEHDWYAYIYNGRDNSKILLKTWLDELNHIGVGEILVTSIDNDGRQKGFDLNLSRYVIQNSCMPVVISGGCGKVEDIFPLISKSDSIGVAVGSALHYDKFTIQECKKALKLIGMDVRSDYSDEPRC